MKLPRTLNVQLQAPLLRLEGCSPEKHFLFFGSQTGGRAAAIAYTLIETAKLNGVDPQAWLADRLACIADYKITRVADLLPWRLRAGIKKDPLPT